MKDREDQRNQGHTLRSAELHAPDLSKFHVCGAGATGAPCVNSGTFTRGAAAATFGAPPEPEVTGPSEPDYIYTTIKLIEVST